MPTKKEILKDAFAGESQANQKHHAFSKKAERIYVEGHLGALDGIGSTVENLKAAIDCETYEYKEMYPPMLE